jgi:hypothetical protein
MAFPVALQFRFRFVDAKHFSDIIVIGYVFHHRKNRLENYGKPI